MWLSFARRFWDRIRTTTTEAEAVARYALALESQGKLNNYKRVWFPDAELQGLTRSYAQRTQQMTAEVNRLWKLLKVASVDLYLTLGGTHPEAEIDENVLQKQGILALLAAKADIWEWKTFTGSDFLQAMGGRSSSGRQKLIVELQKVTRTFQPIPASLALMIQNAANQILLLKKQQREIRKTLEVITRDNKAVKALEGYKGISTITASTMVAEIIDIRRFVRDDSLASYAGLGMKELSTGSRSTMVHGSLFNHRLKNIFITAAKNYVLYNPDSHLAGYYRNLMKGGMSQLEARKRVARALVRVFFQSVACSCCQHK